MEKEGDEQKEDVDGANRLNVPRPKCTSLIACHDLHLQCC